MKEIWRRGRFEVELWLKWNCRKFMNANQRRIRPILGHNSILSSSSLPPVLTICNHSRFPHCRLEEATLLLWTGHKSSIQKLLIKQIWPLPPLWWRYNIGTQLSNQYLPCEEYLPNKDDDGEIKATIKVRYWDLLEESAAAVNCHSAEYKTGTIWS